VGCAKGALPVQLGLAHRHLQGFGFDLPAVRPYFDEYVRTFDLGERLRFIEGDFFKDDLPKGDVVIMGRILHDWDLGIKKSLIKKAFRALPVGGAFIAYENILDDDRKANTEGLIMNLTMLLETNGGFEYTESEGREWLREAGFSKSKVIHLAGPVSMLVGTK
jgi:hypothetical protein